jgi:NAD(P)-dependent dehydrogenase (short-subunit alcohol dehydrogenase family)
MNNAGIMGIPNYATSADGIEMQFAANHVGHFLLTNLLVPLISEGGRIVNLSSAGHALGDVRFDDWNFDEGRKYDEWEAYGQAKSGNALFALSLAGKLKKRGVVAFSLHPGNIWGTGLAVGIGEVDWPAVMKRFEAAGK